MQGGDARRKVEMQDAGWRCKAQGRDAGCRLDKQGGGWGRSSLCVAQEVIVWMWEQVRCRTLRYGMVRYATVQYGMA